MQPNDSSAPTQRVTLHVYAANNPDEPMLELELKEFDPLADGCYVLDVAEPLTIEPGDRLFIQIVQI
jgi:hypothetical protein